MKTILNRHYGGMICRLIGVSMGGGGGVMAASTANISRLGSALEKYCVPKCTSGCSNTFIAEYKNGNCICPANLKYDAGLRECIVKCPTGTYAGYGATCPSGTYKVGAADEHGVMAAGTVCPSGSYKLTIN
jgi:hypothetical protein